jgi:predicted membrane protein
LNFSDNLPLSLHLNSGVGNTRLALTGMKVTSLSLESGVGEARLSMYEPNDVACDSIRVKNGVGHMSAVGLGNLNFHDFEFEGGVGGATLDFSGNWKQDANVRIQVGVGGVRVLLPRDIGVRVDAEKNFLSGIHLEDFTSRDSVHYSDNYDKARIRVSFRVITGIGGFRVSWL